MGDKHWLELRDESFKKVIAGHNRKQLEGKTPNQKLYLKTMADKTVTVCAGPAGTGKTFMACGLASQMLKAGKIERIVLTRPLIPCGNGYGYRPGTVEEKVGPDMRPMVEALDEFLGKAEVEKLMRARVIEMWPMDDMRGANIPNTFIICDESQNSLDGQLRMLLTRFATGSKVVVCGDATQTDLKHGGVNSLLDLIARFSPDCHKDIGIVRLGREDIVRHPLLQWIDERYDGPTPAHVEYHPSMTIPTYAPHEDPWESVKCPKCGKTVVYELWAREDDRLMECFHWNCRAVFELLDEQGRVDPFVVDPDWDNEDFSAYVTRDVKPYGAI